MIMLLLRRFAISKVAALALDRKFSTDGLPDPLPVVTKDLRMFHSLQDQCLRRKSELAGFRWEEGSKAGFVPRPEP
jgi:hypothetical protein